MTPAERADRLMADFMDAEIHESAMTVIAKHIRAAENDALERAAKVLDNGSFLHSEAPTAVWARQVSAIIRELKHGVK